MHDTIIRMKDGREFCAPIYKWHPKEGWFQLFDGEPLRFAEVKSGSVPDGNRVRDPVEGHYRASYTDVLNRAKNEGWDGVS